MLVCSVVLGETEGEREVRRHREGASSLPTIRGWNVLFYGQMGLLGRCHSDGQLQGQL